MEMVGTSVKTLNFNAQFKVYVRKEHGNRCCEYEKLNEEAAEESEKLLVMEVEDFVTLDGERICCEDCGKQCWTRDKHRKRKNNNHVLIN